MLKRTLLGAAVASALFAGAATAGVVAITSSPSLEANSPGALEQYASPQANYKAGLSVESGAGLESAAANITLAQEIFGNKSEESTFELPSVTYVIDPTKAAMAEEGHTVKLTLGRTAVRFAKAVTPNQIQIAGLAEGTGFTIATGSGSSDNVLELRLNREGADQVKRSHTIHFNFRTPSSLDSTPAKVTNMRAPLQGDATFVSGSWNPKVSLLEDPLNELRFEVTVSAQFDTTTGTVGGDPANNDSAEPLKIFTSLPAVYWDVLSTNQYGQHRVLHPLDLNNQDRSFDASVSVGSANSASYGSNYARLGAVRLGINKDVLNEAGRTVFGFAGGDKVTSTLTGNFSGISDVGITSQTCEEFAAAPSAAVKYWNAAAIKAALDGQGNATLPVSFDNANINQVYNVCVKASGSVPMQALQRFDVGDLKVDFENVRYVDRTIPGNRLDEFWKNSCVASLFNLPSSSVSDQFFIRLTNTSDDGRNGKVRGILFDQNGKRYPATGSSYLVDSTGKTELKAHETGVYTVAEVAKAFGVDGSSWNGANGRARLVLEGEFPTCEALGLIRSANGTITNMTSTTQGNFNEDGSSTSENHKAGNNRN
ncbi:hypothetical protein E8F20_03540 [Pseudomonas sp. BN415]|uniref:hypothetical protein n=1 Tax=Pseudomonas sp. BN415 TaxID=2567889 RepID=UPI0024570EAC|nr:hypothetical protein [Pseudomonas sp. BN415]MDH4580946.1 hypothetical protein [Pseudomonas sp. BN415]